MKCNDNCCSISKCDIFDFMANHIGLTVIHPGGLNATKKLLDRLDIKKTDKVIDIACGKGSSTLYIAEKYGCEVTGVDLSPELIAEARRALGKKEKLKYKVKFLTADAQKLPFKDNTFDAAVSQAMLVLVDNKIRTIKEARRVIKNKGRAGWLELSWQKTVTKNFLQKISDVLCAYCMKKVMTYTQWLALFKKAGINSIQLEKGHQVKNTFWNMLKDEGFFNTLRIIRNIAANKEIGQRIRQMNHFFRHYDDHFGYGIYYFQK